MKIDSIVKPLRIIDPESWVIHDTRLPNEFCDMILDHFAELPDRAATAKNAKGHRRCGMRWDDQTSWIGPFLWQYIQEVNERIFQYDLSSAFASEIHQLEYRPGHYYHWHRDDMVECRLQYAPPHFTSVRQQTIEYVRKLSFSLQLSDEDEYTGGDLQILPENNDKVITVPKKRGTLVIFDSRTRHRIKPVKSGKRFVLVGWVVGPRWK